MEEGRGMVGFREGREGMPLHKHLWLLLLLLLLLFFFAVVS